MSGRRSPLAWTRRSGRTFYYMSPEMERCSGIERRTGNLPVWRRSPQSAMERTHNGENPRKSSYRRRRKRLQIRSSSWREWRQSRAMGASPLYRGPTQSLINTRWQHPNSFVPHASAGPVYLRTNAEYCAREEFPLHIISLLLF